MAGILENTVFYGFVTTGYTVPIPIINGHRLKRMFGDSRGDRDHISASPPEPPNSATIWAISTFDCLLNAAMISQNIFHFLLGVTS